MKLTKNLVLQVAYKLGTYLKDRHFRESTGFFARTYFHRSYFYQCLIYFVVVCFYVGHGALTQIFCYLKIALFGY